jgi:hypothetical protein
VKFSPPLPTTSGGTKPAGSQPSVETDVVDQVAPRPCQLDPAQSTEAESGDGHPCDHSLLVGEPAHPDGDGNDVAQSDPGAADQTDPEQHQPEIGSPVETCNEVAKAECDTAGEGKTLWSPIVELAPCEHHDNGEQGKAD